MKAELFDELVASVRQGGAILRGKGALREMRALAGFPAICLNSQVFASSSQIAFVKETGSRHAFSRGSLRISGA